MQTSPRQKHNIVILRDLSLRMLSSVQQREKSYSDRLPEDDWVEPLQFWQCHLFKTEGQTAGCFSLSWRLLQDQDNTTYHYSQQTTHPFAFLDLPLPAYVSRKARERQTWPPLRLVQCPSLWIRNGQYDVRIFFFSLVFRDIKPLLFILIIWSSNIGLFFCYSVNLQSFRKCNMNWKFIHYSAFSSQ